MYLTFFLLVRGGRLIARLARVEVFGLQWAETLFFKWSCAVSLIRWRRMWTTWLWRSLTSSSSMGSLWTPREGRPTRASTPQTDRSCHIQQHYLDCHLSPLLPSFPFLPFHSCFSIPLSIFLISLSLSLQSSPLSFSLCYPWGVTAHTLLVGGL